MVHTLFWINSRIFYPTKITRYTVATGHRCATGITSFCNKEVCIVIVRFRQPSLHASDRIRPGYS